MNDELGFVWKRHLRLRDRLRCAVKLNPPYPLSQSYHWYLSLPFVFIVGRASVTTSPAGDE